MTEQDFFNRLVTFSFGGHECPDTCTETIILMPEGISAEEFKDRYNNIIRDIEDKNMLIHKELEKNREKCREISLYMRKYKDKENIKEKAQAKIDKKEKELDSLLQEWSETRQKLVNIDVDSIIESIGGIIIENKVSNEFSDHNNSSMTVH